MTRQHVVTLTMLPPRGRTLEIGCASSVVWLLPARFANACRGWAAYWLDVGSAPGGNNCYKSGNLGNVVIKAMKRPVALATTSLKERKDDRRCRGGSNSHQQLRSGAKPGGRFWGFGGNRKSSKQLVGERGFEPPTPWSRTRCSTRLSHSPTCRRYAWKYGAGRARTSGL